MSGRRTFRFGGGLISVFMVLLVLMLSTFAVLSWVTASSEEKLADRAERAASDYYRAVGAAAQDAGQAAFFAEQGDSEGMAALGELDGDILTLVHSVDDRRQLRTVYRIGKSAPYLSLLSQTVESTAEWEEESMNLWTGE